MLNRLWRPRRSSDGGLPSPRLYRRYREKGRELVHRIIETYLDNSAIYFTAKALGMERQGNTIIFDEGDEMSVLMDCALYEYKKKGKNTIERYQEEVGGKNKIEREILAAMVVSSTSLFRVESISRQTYSLTLDDLVDEDRTITLMDIYFSQSAKPGHLLFFRPIPLESFSMSSGVAFIFPSELERELVERWQKPQPRGSSRSLSKSMSRYVTFFKLNKSQGIKMMYRDASESGAR